MELDGLLSTVMPRPAVTLTYVPDPRTYVT